MNADAVYEALARRHPEASGEWLLLREPFGIDAFAIRCWSGGKVKFRRVAYEVKVSWSDLQRELERPHKRRRAVEISDQFFFAMPAELAARFHSSGACPPEAGILAVHDDGQARRMLRAPLRQRRELTIQEEVALLRFRHNPAVRRNAIARANRADKWNEHLVQRIDLVRGQLDEAHQALVRTLGHTVSVGTRWRGDWPARDFPKRPAMPSVLVEVEELTTYGSVRLRTRLGDAAIERRSETLGAFLATHSLVEPLSAVG